MTSSCNASDVKPVYRFYSLDQGSHFFTTSETEKKRILTKYKTSWRYEGIAFYVPKSSSGNKPVYRFYSLDKSSHFFTSSQTEKDRLIRHHKKSWRYEGIAYYVPKSNSGNKPVYRFYNTIKKFHFFTASKSEKDRIIAKYKDWRYEGVAYYVPPKNPPKPPPSNGPNIAVGVQVYAREDLRNESFKIDANKKYVIKDKNGTKIATVEGNVTTKVKYDGDEKLRIYDSIPTEKIVLHDVYFEAADGNNSNMIFDIHKPGSEWDEYRGKIKLHYTEYCDPNISTHCDELKRIWVINTLPLEHYVWGDGELRGTGDADHNRVMVTSFRTYGYFWINHATKWARAGFIVNATPGNQLYSGYTHEVMYPNIKKAALDTRGKIVTSSKSSFKNNVAITPYSSWTDGRTRSFEERWGSTAYSWCQSVSDPYGNYNNDKYWDHNPHLSTTELMSRGNHMVGLSAHGSVTLANEHGWDWQRIIKYYFKDVGITSIY